MAKQRFVFLLRRKKRKNTGDKMTKVTKPHLLPDLAKYFVALMVTKL